MDSSQSARTGALLGLVVAGAAGALRAGEDLALGNDQDVAVGELLLELTGQARQELVDLVANDEGWRESLPLLDTVEALQGWDGDKDDNSLLAVANLELISSKVSMRAPGC